MFTDFAINQQGRGQFGSGEVGRGLAEVRYRPEMMRPFIAQIRGRNVPCFTLNVGKHPDGSDKYTTYTAEALARRGIYSPVTNATTLRKEEWIEFDRKVLLAARYPLTAWADLSAKCPYGGFNGMSKMILEQETSSDPGEAVVDMDGLTMGRGDQPLFQLQGLPLPITHSDFSFGARLLANSRNTSMPLDTRMGEAAGRRVAEAIEKTYIGVQTGIIYGGNSTQVGGYGRTSQVYGLTNFSPRLTKTNMTAPTAGGWTPEQTQLEFNICLNILRINKFQGPFTVYNSNDWDPYLDGDYYVARTTGAVAPTKTLRERLRAIDGIDDIKRLAFLFGYKDVSPAGLSPVPPTNTAATTGGPQNRGYTGPGGEGVALAGNPFTFLFVQYTPDVVQAVNGMDITTLQWETKGGMEVNFKVMCIQVPRLQADFYGNCGLMQATTA